MNLKELIVFGIENSSEPVIKNPVMRAALEEPRTMAQGGGIIGKPGGLVEPGVMYYGDDVALPSELFKVTKKTSPHYGEWSYKVTKNGKRKIVHSKKKPKVKDTTYKTEKWLEDPKFKKFYETQKNMTITQARKKYEVIQARKNKIVGMPELSQALGDDSPYSLKTLEHAWNKNRKKIIKGMSKQDTQKIKSGHKIIQLINDTLGKPTSLVSAYAKPRQIVRNPVWDLNPSKIKKLNKVLNKHYSRIGELRDRTVDSMFDFNKNNKLMEAIDNYTGGRIKPGDPILEILVPEFKKTGRDPSHALMQWARALRGEIQMEGIDKDVKRGNKIIKMLSRNWKGPLGGGFLTWAKLQMGKHFDDPNATYRSLTRSLQTAMKEAGITGTTHIDEIFPARTGQLTIGKGSGAYNHVIQLIDGKINTGAKVDFDAEATPRYREIIKNIKDKNWDEVNKLVKDHDAAIKEFYEINPQAKGKVKLTQLNYNPKTRTFASPTEIYGKNVFPSKIKKGMDEFYRKTKLSLDVGSTATLEKTAADVKALTQGKAWNKAIKSSKAKMLAKTLELAGIDICSSQLAKAGGGRIGFAEQVCGMKYVEQNEDAFMKKAAQSKKAADIFKSGEIRPFLMKAKNWSKANMGPTGWIGGELLVVGLGAAWDMSQGKGWKEAVDNWTGLGGHFGQAEKRLKQIGIEQGYSEAEINDAMKIGQLMDLGTEAEEKQLKLEQVQEAEDIGGTARYKTDPRRRFVRPKEYVRGEYQDPKRIRDLKTETPKLWEKGDELFESLKDYDFSIGAYADMQQRKKREEYDEMMRLRSKPMMRGYGQQFQVSGEPEFKAWDPYKDYAEGGIASLKKK